MKPIFTRRQFLETTAVTGMGASLGWKALAENTPASAAEPAVLGGSKAHPKPFPAWPIFDQREETALTGALHTGRWGRQNGTKVGEFEKAFQKLTGAKHCIATTSGTTALISSLGALNIGPGDEVILSPYTFIATYNAVVCHYALPIFSDTDLGTFQIDAKKIEAAITPQTKAILPVHVGGSSADMDTIGAISSKHNIPVIEDACQAVMGEWRGRNLGNWGLAGCYSFQSSKNLTSGEGGAIVTNDDAFAERCYDFHNHNHGRAGTGSDLDRSANFRMSEFHGNLLQAQLTRLDEQAKLRDANATYLTQLLNEIPGLKPVRPYEGCTRSSHHLFMMRYDKSHFANLSRERFLAAMAKEGVSCAAGYTPMYKDPYVIRLARNPHYIRVYGEKTMKDWLERIQCPVNDKVCAEAVWLTQTSMLGSRAEIEQIAEAVRKIQTHAAEIAKA